jgi:hypothetical protein
MIDHTKVAAIVKRIKDYNRKAVRVPKGDAVKGVPTSTSGNTDEAAPRQENPLENTMPKDIGPENDQTIAGTGAGPVIGVNTQNQE